MAEADRHAVARHQVAEESQALVAAAHDVDDGREPVLVLRLDAELAFPLGIEQVGVGPGQLVPREQLRVVGLHPHRQQRRRPLLVRRNRAGLQVGVDGHVDRQQDLLARERLHLGRAEMDDVDVVSSRGGFGRRPLEHAIRTGTPDGDLDAVFRFEGLDESRQVLFGDRGVERQRAFMLRCRRVACVAGSTASCAQDEDDQPRTPRNTYAALNGSAPRSRLIWEILSLRRPPPGVCQLRDATASLRTYHSTLLRICRRQRPASNSSVYRFFHLSYSSIETRASTNVIGTLLSGVSTLLLVGTNSRWAMIVCPSSLSSKS